MLLLLSSMLSVQALPNPTWPDLYSPTGWSKQATITTNNVSVEVYSKKVDGFPCFKGEALSDIVPAPSTLDLMISIAADAPSALQWSSADLTESVELQRTETHVDYFQHLYIPVLSNRYWLLRGYPERDKTAYLFRWERLHNGGPHTDFYNKIQQKYPNGEETPINLGAWVLTPQGNGTHIAYLICSHPGGNVPAMLQTVGTEESLPTNIKDMIQETQRKLSNP